MLGHAVALHERQGFEIAVEPREIEEHVGQVIDSRCILELQVLSQLVVGLR